MGRSQREKGKRGERMWRDMLRQMGFKPETTYRSSQFSGKAPDGSSADVVCAELPGIHFEVKNVERLNIWGAYMQAKMDCSGKMPVVAHTKNHFGWLCSLAESDFRYILSCSDMLEEELHWEMQGKKRLNVWGGYAIARHHSSGCFPILLHSNRTVNLATLSGEDFLTIIRRSDLVERAGDADRDTE